MTVRRAVGIWLTGASMVLGGCGDGALPPYVPEARADDGLLSDPQLQGLVEAQAARSGDRLIAALGDPRPEVRARAAFALASVQDLAAVPALVTALDDSDVQVRRDAALALGQAGDPSAVDALVRAFSMESDRRARRAMLEALGKLPDEAAAEALVALAVEGEEEVVRTRAVARLGAVVGIRPDISLVHLLFSLDHRNARVRAAAAYFFGRSREPEAWSASADLVRAALDRSPKHEPAALFLIQGLGRIAEAEDGERLRTWFGAKDWRARTNAALALAGSAETTATRNALLDALDDPSTHVAVAAAQTLAAALDDPVARDRAASWIVANPAQWQVAAPLLHALAREGNGDFVLEWARALNARAEWHRSSALGAVATVPDPEARDFLLGALDDPVTRVSVAALTALGQRWGRERTDPGSHDLYFETFYTMLLDTGHSWTFPAASVLADSLLLDRGGVDTLLAVRSRWTGPEDAQRRRTVDRVLEARGYGDRLPEVAPETDDQGRSPSDPDTADPAGLDWAYLASLGPSPRLVLDTEVGTVVLRLAPGEAPQTVQTITRFARDGRYDGVIFHRVVPNFVAQGGDFSGDDGTGGPGFSIRSEFGTLPHHRGTIGMASSGKDTEGSQFFISHSPQPHLDGGYTVFGWVVEGMDVVDRLQVGSRILQARVEPSG